MKWLSIIVLVACSHAGNDVPVDATAGGDATITSDAPIALAPLRVLTINLKTALPSDSTVEQRTQMVAQLILTEQPDVIALQEVTKSSSMSNRAEALAAATGYAWEYKRTHQLFVGEEGIAIMTRGQITWHADADLPHTEFAGALHRAILGARVTVDEGRSVELFATHLTVAGSTEDRADQIEASHAFIQAHHQAGVPVFVAGDLNAEPGEITPQFPGFVDAWSSSMGNAQGFTIPSDGPDRRIDYIFSTGATAKHCKTVLANAVGGVRASDHLGVICRFE